MRRLRWSDLAVGPTWCWHDQSCSRSGCIDQIGRVGAPGCVGHRPRSRPISPPHGRLAIEHAAGDDAAARDGYQRGVAGSSTDSLEPARSGPPVPTGGCEAKTEFIAWAKNMWLTRRPGPHSFLSRPPMTRNPFRRSVWIQMCCTADVGEVSLSRH